MKCGLGIYRGFVKVLSRSVRKQPRSARYYSFKIDLFYFYMVNTLKCDGRPSMALGKFWVMSGTPQPSQLSNWPRYFFARMCSGRGGCSGCHAMFPPASASTPVPAGHPTSMLPLCSPTRSDSTAWLDHLRFSSGAMVIWCKFEKPPFPN